MDEILRKFGLLQASTESGTAVWRPSREVHVYPEGLCPFCRAVIKSSCIWKLRHGRVIGRWKIVDGALVFTNPVGAVDFHPHVCNGSICMGTAHSEEEALFLGMTISEAYSSWKKANYGVIRRWDAFLKEVWNHGCLEKITIKFGAAGGEPPPCIYCGHEDPCEASSDNGDRCSCTREAGHDTCNVSCHNGHEAHEWDEPEEPDDLED